MDWTVRVERESCESNESFSGEAASLEIAAASEGNGFRSSIDSCPVRRLGVVQVDVSVSE